MRRVLIASLLAGTAVAGLSVSAFAAAKKPTPAPQPDPRIGVLEQQLHDVQRQLGEIKQAQGDTDNTAALLDLKRSTANQYADVNNQIAALNKMALDNGRLAVATPDGSFTLALRALVQFDIGH